MARDRLGLARSNRWRMGGAILTSIDLARAPIVKAVLRNRWPQFVLRIIALAGFVFAIVAGLIGTPVGSHNFAIVFVWIAWWAVLMLIAVPILGRGWCSICPIPMPGEWLQNGAALGPNKRGFGHNRRWPKKLRNIWLQNSAFTLVALFSLVVLTTPNVTSIVLLALLFIAIGTSLIFERRSFCRYLCPVGGFIGLYSQLAPIELRVKDISICVAHTEKSCYIGSADGYGCPWNVYPAALTKNINCGLCLECLRTCSQDNIAINLRSFGADLGQKGGRKLDEAFKAFIMLGSAMIYSAVMLGPWGELKSAAYSIGTWNWLIYAIAFIALIFGVLPGLFLVAVVLSRKLAEATTSLKKTFSAYAYALVPLGLTAWIAFSISFVFTNISYAWSTASDPLGSGWNLLGTAQAAWTPYITQSIPLLQVIVLLIGLAWSSATARRIANETQSSRSATLQALPVVGYCCAITIGLLGLLIG